MKFTDAASLSGTRRTGDGYLVADAFAVRTGIQLYSGAEMGHPEKDVVRVYRPESEVRAADSLRTFSHAPVTMGHPDVMVDATNWKQLAVGEVSTEAAWQDGKIKLPLILKDATSIAAVENGTRELSAGYTCRVEFVDGVTEDGQSYDAVQREIRANHLAIVPHGRAGTEFRIGDGAVEWGVSPVHDATKEVNVTLRKIMVDGLSVETTDAGAQAIEKLTGIIAAKDAAIAAADAAHQTAIAAKDADLAKANAAKDAAEAKVLDAAAIDKLVADRADLLGKAKAIAPEIQTAGLNDADIRKAVVVAKLGDAMKDKPAAYIDARFDILTEDAAKAADPVATALRTAKPIVTDAANEDAAFKDYLAGLNPARKEA
ncbi:DUF2213 domain-containing protein [Falsirhodobacter sp. 20TX0035]|uniref:DUF2213 domain-containing protein n=1 Tax=Falsirhodobacter sp. 20TX0035 TaxID=3022019 RepID=UPI00232DC43C|nr:DUF2213 domain-containing protein [Falsirhodobacter sp. 20TX0035]MDB6454705.1 DUF2213 domain-containing protein [Falsirhodobacter sp. 20TX0035]